ncbi:MAG TPA: TonB-dependent receptor, partial [Xanthomonadales bacterium]|nr:TonB-dependent receptor [Xanthomonadales bacterium]
MSTTAIAQEEEAGDLEEVVVTATKRDQTLDEIPMSITVLGGNMLERQQAFDFEDMTALIPGFSITGNTPGVTRITLRGTNTGGVASTVGVYFDEVPFGSSTALANGAVLSGDFDTFDMNRIEVLRGPQGTLYGASSLGGVMKYVPNKPSTEGFEGSAKLGVEDVSDGGMGYNATGYVNVPLSDTFALRASAFYREDDGWIDSIGDRPLPSLTQPGVSIIDGTMVEKGINESETSGGRIQAAFTPNDEFSINFLAMFQDIYSGDSAAQEADGTTFKPVYSSPVASRYQNAFDDISYDVYSATIDWEFSDWASVQSVTSWGAFEQDIRDDLSGLVLAAGVPLASLASLLFGTPMGVAQEQITSTDKFTQEFRLVSAESDKFEWLAGLYYTDEDSLIFQELPAITPNTDTPIPNFPLLGAATLKSKYEEIALFANATWFMTDRFETSFGARQSDNDQSVVQTTAGPLAGGASEITGDSSESPFTWSVSPRFQLTEDSSLYGRVATGFRPGGPNVVPPTAPDSVPTEYESDSLINYEVGYKMNSADGRFALELASFY